ncbi:MAG: glycosyltransferase [Dehalococcoidales bacterium]|nr:glycosyltransferase [Dehalococcoidales bacterium]
MKDEKKRPIKVLHVIGGFNVGGVETWLLNVARNLSRTDYQFDFFAISPKEATLENEVFKLGCRIFKTKSVRPSILSIYCDLRKVVHENGPYGVLHSHVHYFNGVILFSGFLLGIPIRIAHSHIDTRVKEKPSGFLRQCYIGLMKIFIRLFATCGIGVSSIAAEDQFGLNWKRDKRWSILPCGIDFSRFDTLNDLSSARSLGIPVGAKVIGHVGRFDQLKNHHFLIDIFNKLLNRGNNVFLLLAGNGILEEAIEEKVALLGISDRVFFLGIRRDVPDLLRSVIDVFLFPSLWEGLPLAFIEAQLAGCYCVGSDNLSKEVVLDNKRVALLSLEEPLDVWASRIEEFLSRPKLKDSEIVLSHYRNSDYELKTNVKRLLSFYCDKGYQI